MFDFFKIIVCLMYCHGIVCMELMWQSDFYATARAMVLTQLLLLQMDGWQGWFNLIIEAFVTERQLTENVSLFVQMWCMRSTLAKRRVSKSCPRG
jgi:hypothetical protein